MAHCAIAVEGVAQVVEGWGQAALDLPRGSVDRKRGVAFETLGGYVPPRQHAWVDRAVRFMASSAAFRSYGRVFEAERAAFIGMALVATWFIGTVARR